MALSNLLATDDLTIILALVAAALFLLHNLYKPQPLVHPILLGRQSDVARVRNPKESAVYRNYGTGMLGRFPVRPAKEQQVLLDLVKPDSDAPRTLWSTKITNPELRQRVSALGTGLVRLANLDREESNVLLLLNDGIEFLLTDLALASHSIPSFTLSALSLLSPVLEEHPPSAIVTDAKFLPQLLELIHDSNEGVHHTVVVVGDLDKPIQVGGVRILKWSDIEREGAQLDQIVPPAPKPTDVFTVSFFANPDGQLRGTSLTHENITAGVTSTRALLPLSGAISPLDTIVSGHSMSTPFGRAVAYTAVSEGTNFATLKSTRLLNLDESELPFSSYSQTCTLIEASDVPSELEDLTSVETYPIPSPTLLFAKPSHLTALSNSILKEAKQSSWLLHSLAWRHKVAGVLEGFITKQSLWDRLVFDDARVKVMGAGAGTIRGVVVSGGPLEAESLMPARIALSVPIVNAYIHPAVSGPVLASHPLDLQSFPPTPPVASGKASASDNFAFAYQAPVGPPTINAEVKLAGVDDDSVEKGEDPVGYLLVRGPTVGKLIHVDEDERENVPEEERGWLETGERARVLSNGTFKVAVSTPSS
ncbi:acetyl-CoA synthetase-like protein [Panus rudis PR-1116 ss-1]|nr:acetyl-CoA synthetase-like protein [Panus rudis PR-1116 ss-1]